MARDFIHEVPFASSAEYLRNAIAIHADKIDRARQSLTASLSRIAEIDANRRSERREFVPAEIAELRVLADRVRQHRREISVRAARAFARADELREEF